MTPIKKRRKPKQKVYAIDLYRPLVDHWAWAKARALLADAIFYQDRNVSIALRITDMIENWLKSNPDAEAKLAELSRTLLSLQVAPTDSSMSATVNQDVTALDIATSDEDETPEELLSAYALADKMYKKLAQLLHPDRSSGDAELFDRSTKLRDEGDLIGLKILYLSHFTPVFPTQEQMLEIAHIYRASASQWATFVQSRGYQAYSARMSGRLFTTDAVIREIVSHKMQQLEKNIQIAIERNIERSRRTDELRKQKEMGNVDEVDFGVPVLDTPEASSP